MKEGKTNEKTCMLGHMSSMMAEEGHVLQVATNQNICIWFCKEKKSGNSARERKKMKNKNIMVKPEGRT